MGRFRWLLVLPVVAAFVLAGAADAEKKKKGKKAEEAPPPKAAEEYELLQKGHLAFLVRDNDKALGYYKQAAEIASKNPEVHYYVGCVQKAKGEPEDAIESFRTAFLMATGKDEAWKGPALVQIAFTLEAQGKLKEAREAWEDYLEYAKGKDVKANASVVATERIKAIDKVMELEEQYAPVRDLIKEQKEAGK